MRHALTLSLLTLISNAAYTNTKLDCNLAFTKLFKAYRKTEIKNLRDLIMNPQKIIPYLDRFDRREMIKTQSFRELLKLKKHLAGHGFLSNVEKNYNSSYLTIDLENSRNTELVRYLARSSKRFNTKKLTFSFFENIKNHSKGFSIGDRIDLGILSVDDLIANKLNSTVKHELTHQLFNKKREQGIPSIFHGSINANTKPIHRSREFGGYQKYLNLEELYTWTKDITNSRNHAIYFEKAQALSVLANATVVHTKGNINILNKALKFIEQIHENQISQRDIYSMGIYITHRTLVINARGLSTSIPIVSKKVRNLNNAIFPEDLMKDVVFEVKPLINFLREIRNNKITALNVFKHIQKQSDFLKDQSTIPGIELSKLIKEAHLLKSELNEDYKGYIGHQ